MANDRTVLVTGAGGGMGSAAAEHLARLGASVGVTAHTLDEAQRVTAAIVGAGGRAVALECDVTRAESVEEAVAELVRSSAGSTRP